MKVPDRAAMYLINDRSLGGDRVLTAQEVLSLEHLIGTGALKLITEDELHSLVEKVVSL